MSENEELGPGPAQGVWQPLHIHRRLRQSDDEDAGPVVPYIVRQVPTLALDSEEENAVNIGILSRH